MKVGVTGGIGSGKSAVCQLFAGFGIPTYNCDDRAREIMCTENKVRTAIQKFLGPETYSDNVPNREFIAGKVFNNKELLDSLNAIVHPAVTLDFEAWARGNAGAVYLIAESAVLFESGFDRLFDVTINVAAPENMRIKRVVARGGMSEQQVVQRMKNQLTEGERRVLADYTIENTGTFSDLKDKVLELDKEFRK